MDGDFQKIDRTMEQGELIHLHILDCSITFDISSTISLTRCYEHERGKHSSMNPSCILDITSEIGQALETHENTLL